VNDLIQKLIINGWQEDGQTSIETMRIPTLNAPVFGNSGGKLITIGGRLRMKKQDWYVTIGKRTTNFYQKDKMGAIYNFNNFKTKDIKNILLFEKNLTI
jgi:hypothetical protein